MDRPYPAITAQTNFPAPSAGRLAPRLNPDAARLKKRAEIVGPVGSLPDTVSREKILSLLPGEMVFGLVNGFEDLGLPGLRDPWRRGRA